MDICENLKTVFRYHVVKELLDRFGQTLPKLTIEHAASFCEFDINEATNLLTRISSEMQDDDQESSVDIPAVRRVEAAQYSPTFVSSGGIPEKSQKTYEIERVISRIKLGFKVLVILRGLPGSGKSYLAKKITEATLDSRDVNNHILSTDNYFETPFGYYYDPARIREAHQWNQARASKAMSRGLSPVIIDNTNRQMYEMKPYATTAMDYGYFVEILEPDTWWSFDAVELAKRNVHWVPKFKIDDMISSYFRNITTEMLLSTYSRAYDENRAKLRIQPPVEMTSKVQHDKRFKGVVEKAESSPPNGHVNFDTVASASGSAFETVDLLDLIDFDTEVNQDDKAIDTTMDESNNPDDQISKGFKVLCGTSRNISSGGVSTVSSSTPEKSMHDQSCWTDDDMNDDTKAGTEIQPLSWFSSLRRSHSCMKHLFNRYLKKSDTAINGLVKDHGHVDDSKTDSNVSDAGSLNAQNHDGRSSSMEPPMRKTTTSEHVFGRTVRLEEASDVDKKHESDEQPDSELTDKSSSPSIVDNAGDSPDEGFYDSHEDNAKDSVELNSGEGVLAQLEAKFGFLEHVQGVQPVMKLPVQLMDSQKQVLEQVGKEDEEFARKLQSKEDEHVQAQRGISSNEIFDEQTQTAANDHERDGEKWETRSADNITFVEEDPILELLHFVQASISSDVSIEPKVAEPICSNIPEAVTEPQEIHQAACYHREQANMHFNRRVRLYQEAHGHYQRGLTALAMLHSDLAAKESQLLDRANNFAVNLFLKEQAIRLQDDYTLDLHHLHVKEAVAVLDVFVDKNISALQDGSSDVHKSLRIITGRGNGSFCRKPRIKPAVISRLIKRYIPFYHSNAGALNIRVTRSTLLSSDVPTES